MPQKFQIKLKKNINQPVEMQSLLLNNINESLKTKKGISEPRTQKENIVSM